MTDAVRAALAGLELLFKREGEDASDAFERVAEVFRRETGYLRPGKDCRLHDIDVRRAAWDAWYASKIEAARAALSEQPAIDMDELRRAVCLIGTVGTIDGHDVIRRNSALKIIDARIDRANS